MKKIIIGVSVLAVTGFTQTIKAQEEKIKSNQNEEIIIRKHGDKNIKITVEINGDDILINGKPIAEFNNDDITIMKKRSLNGKNQLFFNLPERHDGSLQFWNDNDEDNEPGAFLGVETKEEVNGVKITDVVKGSAAEKAGLQEGDIITKIGDKKLNDPEELSDAVSGYKPKEELKVYYERKGKPGNTKVTLGERKVSRMRSFSLNAPPAQSKEIFRDFNFNMDSDNNQPFFKHWGNGSKKIGVKIEDIENEDGAKVTSVETGSAAEKAGLKKDDIITMVDGNKVKNVDDARSKVMETDKTAFTIRAKRNNAEMSFEIKIPKKINNADL